MPRRARLTLPNLPLHIIQRGQACFFEDEDYQWYLRWLGEYAPQAGCRVHAYVLMTSPVHLLLSADRADAAGQMMKALGQRAIGQSHLPAQRHLGRTVPVMSDAGGRLPAHLSALHRTESGAGESGVAPG
jgi:putative transposase